MRGRFTAMPLAKSRNATRIASMQSGIGISRFTSSSVMMMVMQVVQLLDVARVGRNLSFRRGPWQTRSVLGRLANLHRAPARLGSGDAASARPLPIARNLMKDDFEDHCWKDVIPPETLEVYSCYKRKTYVGPSAALLAIDLY